MAREVDERKKRAALRKLRKAAALAEQGLGPPLSDWEREFLEEVEARIEEFGSAFADPSKGADGEALSSLQQVKLKEIDKKTRGKARSGFQSRRKGEKPAYTPRVRQINEFEDEPPASEPSPQKDKAAGLRLVKAADLLPPEKTAQKPVRPKGRPVFRVIEGGAEKSEN